MQQRSLGPNGPSVSAIGLGCMGLGLADAYTSSLAGEQQAVALIRRALDLGVNFIDTANVYGDSEIKVGKALQGRRDGVVLATKFGIVTDHVNSARRSISGRPDYVRSCCETSLTRLGVDTIDLYYQHRVDPSVPIEETVGAMAGLVREGKVRWLGLSEAAPETIRRAHRVHPITALQNEYSLWTRDPEQTVLPLLRELGIALVAYSPLGRGFLAGRFHSRGELAADDWRRATPRFLEENFERNRTLAARIAEAAQRRGCTAAQLLLAWVLAQGRDIVPIPGTTHAARLEENLAAADLVLTADELAELDQLAPPGAAAGARYAPEMLAALNR